MTVILEGYIKVPLEELETIKNNLDEHIQNTLNEHGCLEFTVEKDSNLTFAALAVKYPLKFPVDHLRRRRN